ncbi:MAG: signal peptidase I [Anaerovoracaceae bacterium]|jgi:signal peptidase I
MRKNRKINAHGIDDKTVAARRAVAGYTAADAVIAIAAAAAVNVCLGSVRVKETSMQPNFFDGDVLLIDKTAYRRRAPRRGDVIVFRTRARGLPKYFIKRVIGLPGDVVGISGGEVRVNGKTLDQSYTKDGITGGAEAEEREVPAGRLFVLGDNRAVSLDSRNDAIGCVRISDVEGTAFFRLAPRRMFGRLPRLGADE